MTDRPTSTKPHSQSADGSPCTARWPTSAETEPESDLTRRAREVLAGLHPLESSLLHCFVAETHIVDCAYNWDTAAHLRRLECLEPFGAEVALTGIRPSDLGRECARLLALEVGRG